jgi:hypothetical protein
MYRVYLVGIIDDHSRYIVGHGLYRQQTADAVLEVVRGAVGQWGAPREILSDNGRQFVAWRGTSRFQQMMKRHGVQHVRSAPQHPMTLGKIERFWRTIWEEFLHEAVFASFADARQRLDHWVAYYNHQRPHQGIDGACPADRYYGIASDVDEALKQGCRENALQLALGEKTRAPLYLLGKLGQTEVQITRKGDAIEVKLGDTVREVIRLGAPYEVDAGGNYRRGEATDEVEGDERGGALPGGAAGEGSKDAAQGAVPELRSDAADPSPGDGQDGGGGSRGACAEAARSQGHELRGAAGAAAAEQTGVPGEGSEPLEDEV